MTEAEMERLRNERNYWQMNCEEAQALLGEARAEAARLREQVAILKRCVEDEFAEWCRRQ